MTKYFRFKSFYELQKQAQKEYLEVNDRLMTEDEVIAFVEEARKEIRKEKEALKANYSNKRVAQIILNKITFWCFLNCR